MIKFFYSSTLLTKYFSTLSFREVRALRFKGKHRALGCCLFSICLLDHLTLQRRRGWWCWLLQRIIFWRLLLLMICQVVLPHSILINELLVTFATHHKWKAFLFLLLNFLLAESFHLFLLTFQGPWFVLDFFWIVSSPDGIIYVCPISHAFLLNQEGRVLLFANFCLCLCRESLI